MVTEIITEVDAERGISPRDLPLKSHERLFFERVPLPARGAGADPALRTASTTPGSPRASRRGAFARCRRGGEFMTREQVAATWFREEYEPVTEMMREAGLCGRGTETEAYVRRRQPPLPAAAHPRLERRGDRAAARGARAPAARRGHLRPPAARGPRYLNRLGLLGGASPRRPPSTHSRRSRRRRARRRLTRRCSPRSRRRGHRLTRRRSPPRRLHRAPPRGHEAGCSDRRLVGCGLVLLVGHEASCFACWRTTRRRPA